MTEWVAYRPGPYEVTRSKYLLRKLLFDNKVGLLLVYTILQIGIKEF